MAEKKKTRTKKKETKSALPAAKAAKPVEPKAVAPAQKKTQVKAPKGHKYYGTGRRKEAIARVWLKPGSGAITLNGQTMSDYLCNRKVLEFKVTRPLAVTNTRTSYDVFAESFGGGIPGQADAIALGIARALLEVSPDLRIKLKREGLLRRDPRMKERKKYGLKRARRAFQYTKR
ncbi:MAG: 30S ribosomal protein S9 [Candidatus Saganbacteria bacterium]|nr:30S ribosomal protein S9 [Candidatus Saganbacteria bacterium]